MKKMKTAGWMLVACALLMPLVSFGSDVAPEVAEVVGEVAEESGISAAGVQEFCGSGRVRMC